MVSEKEKEKERKAENCFIMSATFLFISFSSFLSAAEDNSTNASRKKNERNKKAHREQR